MRALLRALGKVLRGAFIALLAAVLAVNVALLASRFLLRRDPPQLFGFTPLVVTSGSMEPTLPVGAMVIARAQEDYQVGDIISFRQGGSVVTHSVVEVTSEGYRTAGDANNAPDAEVVPPQAVLGRAIVCLPWVGRSLLALRGPTGILALAAVGAALVLLPGRHGKERYEDTEKKA